MALPYRFFSVIGPQGSGKGTQARLMSAWLSLPHISTGDIYRKHIREKTALGQTAERFIGKGKLVPDDVTNRLIAELIQQPSYQKGVILDGYPRTLAQAEYFHELVSKYLVVYLNVPDEEVVLRMSGRRMCERGHVYHVTFNPPRKKNICDVDGLPLFSRDDDTPDFITKRLYNYHHFTTPLLSFYKKKGVLMEINGAQPIRDVFQEIKKSLKVYDTA